MTAREDQTAAIVRAFEYERDMTLEGSSELERLAKLTSAECRILANAAIVALIDARDERKKLKAKA